MTVRMMSGETVTCPLCGTARCDERHMGYVALGDPGRMPGPPNPLLPHFTTTERLFDPVSGVLLYGVGMTIPVEEAIRLGAVVPFDEATHGAAEEAAINEKRKREPRSERAKRKVEDRMRRLAESRPVVETEDRDGEVVEDATSPATSPTAASDGASGPVVPDGPVAGA